MSLIDALETENTQALGALAAVTAQRNRLRRFVRAQFRYDAENSVDHDFAVSEATLTELDAAWRDVSRHGDLGDEA